MSKVVAEPYATPANLTRQPCRRAQQIPIGWKALLLRGVDRLSKYAMPLHIQNLFVLTPGMLFILDCRPMYPSYKCKNHPIYVSYGKLYLATTCCSMGLVRHTSLRQKTLPQLHNSINSPWDREACYYDTIWLYRRLIVLGLSLGIVSFTYYKVMGLSFGIYYGTCVININLSSWLFLMPTPHGWYGREPHAPPLPKQIPQRMADGRTRSIRNKMWVAWYAACG